MRANNADRAKREQELRLKQQTEAALVAAAERKAQRLKAEALTRNASDAELRSLIRECKNLIEDEISKSKSSFSVYFPKYDRAELERIYANSIAMQSQMGRPSTSATESETDLDALKRLRDFPSLPVDITVESASDSFSGVKRWAASYQCRIAGLQVEKVVAGKRYFFD